ncbi:hypothetical protein FJY70_06325 [candidate division WOR-3 bacterium]|nr:hypothetical protein [candidate division WOR-3 bacterium]
MHSTSVIETLTLKSAPRLGARHRAPRRPWRSRTETGRRSLAPPCLFVGIRLVGHRDDDPSGKDELGLSADERSSATEHGPQIPPIGFGGPDAAREISLESVQSAEWTSGRMARMQEQAGV